MGKISNFLEKLGIVNKIEVEKIKFIRTYEYKIYPEYKPGDKVYLKQTLFVEPYKTRENGKEIEKVQYEIVDKPFFRSKRYSAMSNTKAVAIKDARGRYLISDLDQIYPVEWEGEIQKAFLDIDKLGDEELVKIDDTEI